jgi:hypothetical protein
LPAFVGIRGLSLASVGLRWVMAVVVVVKTRGWGVETLFWAEFKNISNIFFMLGTLKMALVFNT